MADEKKTMSPPPPPPPKEDVKTTQILRTVTDGFSKGGSYSGFATDSKPVTGKGNK